MLCQRASTRSLSFAFMSDAVALPPSPPAEEVVQDEPQIPTRRLLVFELGGSGYACEMDSFREIVPNQPMTRLPGSPDSVCGLINLRGTIVTVIDGGIVLGKPPCAKTSGLILLADYFERLVGVGVDDVCDIHEIPIDQFASSEAPESIGDGIVTGVVESDG